MVCFFCFFAILSLYMCVVPYIRLPRHLSVEVPGKQFLFFWFSAFHSWFLELLLEELTGILIQRIHSVLTKIFNFI